MDSSSSRIAIVDEARCKPKKCNQECKRSCPVVKIGKKCITVDEKIATISESLCNGCGICVKKCPFEAIKIINLPDKFAVPVMFRYGANSFQLHRLPQLYKGSVFGIVGPNGIGKSTIIQLLGNRYQPNFGSFTSKPDAVEIIKHFRGSNLQHYFTSLYSGELVVKVKPQMVEFLSRTVHKTKLVQEMIPDSITRAKFDLVHIADRQLSVLSGGELQRIAIATVYQSSANVKIFDEPTNYLDISQRLRVAELISEIVQQDIDKYVLVVDHDLAILDYMSDYVSCLYGEPGAYGVVSLPYSVREGINLYLDGYLPAENMRIRKEQLRFINPQTDEERKQEEEWALQVHEKKTNDFIYNSTAIHQGTFTLTVCGGGWNLGDIVLLVGRNGTGKTTFIRYLAGLIVGDKCTVEAPQLYISYKPQHVVAKFEGTVRQLLQTKIGATLASPLFESDVLNLLNVKPLFDQSVLTLSGGELQRVAIALALGKSADVYLIDEPSSLLDIEMRIAAATAIRRYVKHVGKSAFIVEHDIIMGMYIADCVITFTGEVGKNCQASVLMDKDAGMNLFLKELDVTIRQDVQTLRPRINKKNSVLDREQRNNGHYFSKRGSNTESVATDKT